MEGQVELYAFLCSALDGNVWSISVSGRFILRRNVSNRPTRWIMKLDMDISTIPAIFRSETPVHLVTAISEPNFPR
jgi:hypothetical protein